MLTATCHCQNVTITVNNPKHEATSCNCSMCLRLGALWNNYEPELVSISAKQETKIYMWGEKSIEFHHCPVCLCCTHYKTIDGLEYDGQPFRRTSVNARMFPLKELESFKIRYFDGAHSWEFLEGPTIG